MKKNKFNKFFTKLKLRVELDFKEVLGLDQDTHYSSAKEAVEICKEYNLCQRSRCDFLHCEENNNLLVMLEMTTDVLSDDLINECVQKVEGTMLIITRLLIDKLISVNDKTLFKCLIILENIPTLPRAANHFENILIDRLSNFQYIKPKIYLYPIFKENYKDLLTTNKFV